MSKKPAPEPDRDRERPDHDLPVEHPGRPPRPVDDDGDPEPTHPIAEPPPVVEPAPQS